VPFSGPPAATPPGARLAVVARANPVAKLAIALAIPLGLILTVDPVTAGTALLLELLALPLCGVGPRSLLRHGWIVLLGALPAGVLTALFGPDGGVTLAGIGPVTLTATSLTAAAAITLRILAIGLPGVVLIATTDPTDLADALAQVLHLPHRFVLSALAAFRLFGVLGEEWRSLTMARRARGLQVRGPAALRSLLGRVFALFVLAIRRATVLAGAMEARGFGVQRERSWARPSRFTPRDAAVALGGPVIIGVATAAGVAAGAWKLILT
jgi:energy-coupling factor transport system permease protein